MKNKLTNLLLVLSFIIGLVFICVNPIQNYLVKNLSEGLNSTNFTVEDFKQSGTTEASFNFEDVQSLTIWDVLKAQASTTKLPVIGSIHIPSIELTLPILKGIGESSLAVGAGTMKPAQKMGEGNYSLASHYFEGKNVLFGPLYDIQEGDSIFLTDLEYMYEYKTTDITINEATDVYIINDIADKTLLTLITCAEKGSKRLVVRAAFVEKTPVEQSTPIGLLPK